MKFTGKKETVSSSKPNESTEDEDMRMSKDAKLYKGLEELNEEKIEVLMETDGREPEFSKEHDAKMRQMVEERFGQEAAERMSEIQMTRQKADDDEKWTKQNGKLYQIYPRFKKIAAAVLIVVMLGAITMSTEAFRVPIVNFIMNFQKEFMGVSVEHSETMVDELDIERIYYLEKTIEGYELFDEIIEPKLVVRRYKNGKQQEYKFTQQSYISTSNFDNEGTGYESVDLIYGEALFNDNNEIYYLTWFYDGYAFEISGVLTKEEMISLAETIALKETTDEGGVNE